MAVRLISILFLVFSFSVNAQCPNLGIDACTTAAPTIVGNSITCNPPINNAGRQNFRVTNMIANATYRISNCNSGVDTQMTIRDLGGTVVGYNDDNGPACAGLAASINFIPPADGSYRIQLNRFNCQSGGSLDNGDILVTLLSLPCALPTPITTPSCPNVDVTPDSSSIVSCGSGAGSETLTANYMDLGDTSDYNVDLITYDATTFGNFAAAATTSILFGSTGTEDDRWSNTAFNIPFDFCFYGNTVAQFVVGTNGTISFDPSRANTLSGFSFDENLPSTDEDLFDDTIYAAYQDLDPSVLGSGQITYGTTNVNGCNALVVLWDDIPLWDNGNLGDNSKRQTVMAVLYENTNIVEILIKEKDLDDDFFGIWNDGNAIVGIQNVGATEAVVAPCRNTLDDNWVATNEAWRFTPSGGSSTATLEWLVDGTLEPTYNGQTTITISPSVTTMYTAQVTYNLCNGGNLIISDDTTVTVVGGKIWDGSEATNNWMNPFNWSDDTIPTATDCIVIPVTGNDPIIYNSDNGIGLNLTIENGATLTQQPNSTLTVLNFIEVETGATYTMEDSASLIQIDDVANTVDGTFTMARTANMRQNDYVYWSSPVANFNVEDISINTPSNFIYDWNPSFDRPDGPPPNFVPNDFGRWESASGLMTLAKGYIVKGPNGHPSTPSPYTATFDGTPNNGNVDIAITRGGYTGLPYVGPGDDLVTPEADNWNLIGNPYPSAISAMSFLALPSNNNVEGSVYLWTHNTDIAASDSPFYQDFVYNYNAVDYLVWTGSGPSIPVGFNGSIAAGQGFFVLMNDLATPTETVTFNNAMRNSSYANDQFYRTSETATSTTLETHRIWLDYVAPNNNTNITLVAYVNGATNEHDRMFDAKNSQGNGLNLYSLINEDMYIIQGRQIPFDETDTVPLGLNISEAGIQTIAINTLEGIFLEENSQIFIEDLHDGIIHNIKNAPYFFNSEAGIVNDRFVLRYNAGSLGVNGTNMSSGVLVYEKQEKIQIESMLKSIANVKVHDVLGRSLFEKSNINQNMFRIDALNSKTQVIFLKISLVDGSQEVVKLIF
ncbi:hypothetical protein J4050_09665 [Winogradskyella sp. DF17]|uniref:T9SS sorting signal type C domain-containing protein n=1 Tax=Winogradskyella pelagia TaxID=2819984 RepID=A0ABS3T2N8_9FLAO|nr:hypothetical protein [Winogradskyella sp. DF17]MBO3117016.1 hypothetical protein [Winogradskyella sp. DF17]